MLARSKLNRIESKMSGALINNEISHEDFITIIDEQREYRLYQRIDTGKFNLIEEGKKVDIDEIIKRNEIIHDSLNSKIQNMPFYCLKSRKNTENLNRRVSNSGDGN